MKASLSGQNLDANQAFEPCWPHLYAGVPLTFRNEALVGRVLANLGERTGYLRLGHRHFSKTQPAGRCGVPCCFLLVKDTRSS